MQPPSFFPVDFSSVPSLSPTANSSFDASLAGASAAFVDPRDADAPAFLRGALAALRARFAAWIDEQPPNRATADLAPPMLSWWSHVGCVAMQYLYESVRVALLAGGALIELCATAIASAAPAVRWPVFCFLACAVAAMLMSATCHLFCNHSPRANCVLTRLDYSGIALLIVGSKYELNADGMWDGMSSVMTSMLGIFVVKAVFSASFAISGFIFLLSHSLMSFCFYFSHPLPRFFLSLSLFSPAFRAPSTASSARPASLHSTCSFSARARWPRWPPACPTRSCRGATDVCAPRVRYCVNAPRVVRHASHSSAHDRNACQYSYESLLPFLPGTQEPSLGRV